MFATKPSEHVLPVWYRSEPRYFPAHVYLTDLNGSPSVDPLNLDGSYKPYDSLPGPVETYPVSGSL